MDNRPRIVFMGTPEFAVASLGALVINNFNVVGVVTSPDKPAGRGRSIKASAVAGYCSENYLRLLKPENLKDPVFLESLRKLEPDIIIVVAFRMLPKEVWEIPLLGTFNLHASLLPQYRGAAPINHAIMNGESLTGITTFLIDDKIDTGKILLRKEVNVRNDDSAGDLHDRLMREGAKLVVRTAELLYLGALKPSDQSKYVKPGEILKPAPKIFTEDCFIDWSATTVDIYNRIRGLSPHPGARTHLVSSDRSIIVKLLKSQPGKDDQVYLPGTLVEGSDKSLVIATGDGVIEIIKLQPEGRRAMGADEFLRGFDISGYRAT